MTDFDKPLNSRADDPPEKMAKNNEENYRALWRKVHNLQNEVAVLQEQMVRVTRKIGVR